MNEEYIERISEASSSLPRDEQLADGYETEKTGSADSCFSSQFVQPEDRNVNERRCGYSNESQGKL